MSINYAEINVGTVANDGTGDSLRASFVKINSGFANLNSNLGNTLVTSTISADSLSATGNITSNYFIGNGSSLTGVGTDVTSSITTANSNMKTYVDGEITTANSNMKTYVDGEITTANSNMKTYVDGEITAIGAHYSDTDVANVLASFGSNTVETTGNVTAGNIIVTGNVFGLKSSPYSMSSNSYTLVAADQDRTIVTTATGNVYIDVPAESSVNFPIGTSISILQAGDGQVIFTNSSPVMLNTAGNSGALRNRYQFTTCGLYKYDSDTWVALGDLIV